MSSRLAASPPAPAFSSVSSPAPSSQGIVDFRILILLTANRRGIDETRCMDLISVQCQDAWHKRASFRYKDLIFEVRTNGHQPDWMNTAQYKSFCDEWGSEAYKKRREVSKQNQL
ncbi:hypothetical protein M9H77_21062 [Catharanthus roseus]|uniref:Uncharacterized protein n=1 Tax=Catharanthus roseus TaxID=4058 RepID=A0ACC0ANK0_CATRO|nr:hypothetical protein M9H77_21062 [Catharanthus roseus]